MGARLSRLLRLRRAALPPDQPFRVMVLLTPDRLPPDTNAGEATVALRRAVLALPGATHIHVQPRHVISREEAWLAISPPGSKGKMPSGRAWAALLARVEATALQALTELGKPSAHALAPAPLPSTPAMGLLQAAAAPDTERAGVDGKGVAPAR